MQLNNMWLYAHETIIQLRHQGQLEKNIKQISLNLRNQDYRYDHFMMDHYDIKKVILRIICYYLIHLKKYLRANLKYLLIVRFEGNNPSRKE